MKERLKQLLNHREKHIIVDTSRLLSAVLLPIYKSEEQYHLVFIKRTETVKQHKGEISFPGGTCEEIDQTLLDTALRECTEEIGLCTEDVEVLGELDDVITVTSNYIVSPFVAMIPWPYCFEINNDEVDEIIKIPLLSLLDENCVHQDTDILNGQTLIAYTYYYQDRVIWGATARILNRFLDMFARAISDT